MRNKNVIGVPCPHCNFLVPPGRLDTISMISLDRANLAKNPEHYHGDHFIAFLRRIALNTEAIKYLRNNVFHRPPTTQEALQYALTLAFMQERNCSLKPKRDRDKIYNKIKRINLIAYNHLGIKLNHTKSDMWADYLQSPRSPNEDKRVHSFVPDIPCEPLKSRYIFSGR
ncbi:MAG: hypothetical protein NTY12_05060 [Candidatus Falkowbacteria bacterium]|nr:hypothetical protein [Candidatus Falkowbacteria bacterium]